MKCSGPEDMALSYGTHHPMTSSKSFTIDTKVISANIGSLSPVLQNIVQTSCKRWHFGLWRAEKSWLVVDRQHRPAGNVWHTWLAASLTGGKNWWVNSLLFSVGAPSLSAQSAQRIVDSALSSSSCLTVYVISLFATLCMNSFHFGGFTTSFM